MTAEDALSAYPPERRVYWVGAGVSSPEFPLGSELTRFVLNQLLGMPATDSLLSTWMRFDKFARGVAGQSPGPLPRLEAILEQAFGLEGAYGVDEFALSRGFLGWRAVGASPQHTELAKIVRAGSCVVTVNFDLGIEDAFAAAAGYPLVSRPLADTPRFVDPHGTGSVVHLHGTVEDPGSLVATVDRMMKGLPRGFEDWIHQSLDQGSALVFAGYGALDSFDVTPFFARPGLSFPRSAGVYFSHDHGRVPNSVPRLLAPFGRSAVDGGDTGAMLARAAAAGVWAPTARAATGTAWDDAFLASAELSAVGAIRGVFVLGLAQSLGISPRSFYPAAFAEAASHADFFSGSPEQKRWIQWRLGIVYRLEGDLARETWHYMRGGPSVEALTSWMSARGVRLGIAAPCVAALRTRFDQAASMAAPLNWDYTTLLGARCETIFRTESGRHNSSTPPSVLAALKLLDDFISREFNGVEYVNQQAFALRKRFLLKAIAGVSPAEDFDRALQLYSDNTSVDGFIGTFRDMARATRAFSVSTRSADAGSSSWARDAVSAAQILQNPRQLRQSLAVLGGLK